MRVLYLTQWFEPEPAFKGLDFARALADRGHHVEVATAFPNYPGGQVYPGYRIRPYQRELMKGFVVHRLLVWPSHNRSSVGRVLNYASFWLSSLMFGLLRGRRYDVVYVYHPPITPALAATLYCRLWRRPFVLEIQDLWPDSVASSGMAGSKGGPVLKLLNRLCAYAYQRATTIITQSDGMKERLIERGVRADKVHRIYNWSTYVAAEPEDRLPERFFRAFSDKVNLVYGGNLGQAQGLETVIDALARAVRDYPGLHLHLYGDGIERSRLAAHADALGLQQAVTFHGAVPRSRMDRIFDQSDVLVVHLKADPLYEVTVPSKIQHYLSCGRPIIAGVSGEAANLLRAAKCAIVRNPEDVSGMAAAMSQLAAMTAAERTAIGNRGRSFYNKNLSIEPAVEQTVGLINLAVVSFGAKSQP